MNESLAVLLDDLKDNNPKCTNIRMVYKKLGPIEAKLIASALEGNTHATVLRLDSNLLGDRGAATLAEALKVKIANSLF